MAKLILTESEKKFTLPIDQWSDEVIARSVKYCAAILSDGAADEIAFLQTCAHVLIASAIKTGATKKEIIVRGLKEGPKKLGSWRVTFEEIKL